MALHPSYRHNQFGAAWRLVNDPNEVQTILKSLAIPNPEQYNQLMVASSPDASYYSVYAARVHHEHPILDALKISHPPDPVVAGAAGRPPLTPETEFHRVYDRGDFPFPDAVI